MDTRLLVLSGFLGICALGLLIITGAFPLFLAGCGVLVVYKVFFG